MSSLRLFSLGCVILSFLVGNAQTVNRQSIPLDTTYTIDIQYQKYKKNFPYLIPAKDQTPSNVIEERDIIYAAIEETKFGKRELHLDLFRPQKEGKYPALIMVHGGGWRAGNKSLQVPMAQKIAQRNFVTVAIEYQLSLEAGYPAAVHNIKAAIRWMRANSDKYNIDPNRIAISGCSAGGHLASLIGMTDDMEHFAGNMGYESYSSSVKAVINIDGIVNFLAPTSLNKIRKPDSPDIQWLGGSFSKVPDTWKEASSIYWANENSVPILFINSGFPRFHAGQDELIGLYKEWGIYYEVHKFNVQMHTFWLFQPYMDATVEYMIDFLNKTMK